MFNIGAGEIAIILVLALLILGPKRLPEMARAIGKFLREFRRQTDEVRTTLETEFYRMDRELMREEPRKEPALVPSAPQLPQTVVADPAPPAPVAPDAAAAPPASAPAPESNAPAGDARSGPSSTETTAAPEGRWEE